MRTGEEVSENAKSVRKCIAVLEAQLAVVDRHYFKNPADPFGEVEEYIQIRKNLEAAIESLQSLRAFEEDTVDYICQCAEDL